jgi:hypothetical protein
LRGTVIEGQRRRLAELDPQRIATRLDALLPALRGVEAAA